MGRFSGGRIEDINGVPVRMGGDGGRGNGDVAIHGGGAQWSSLGKTGGGWREQCGRLHQDQAGAAEGGHAAQAADVGFEEAPRQGGTACDSLPQHLRGQVCRELASSNTQPREAFSAHLSLPSPELRDGGWVGRPVGTRGVVVDKFGDNIMCSNQIPGDSWRTRHDTIKQRIVLEAALAKVPTDCEVYGLFSDLLPAVLEAEGGELQWGRARQGKVPDFKFTLASPEGPMPRLAELKVINAGKTWYPRGKEGRGVEKRANCLTKEYEHVLRGYDIRFHNAQPLVQGQPEPAPGPLLARFRNLGGLTEGQLVAGPWGDLSPDFHQLLKLFAESRVAAMGRAQGREAGEGMLGKVMGEIRRSFSVAIVRSQALCLLDRLSHLGPGARAAAQRRQQTLGLEERRRRERQAFALANMGRGLSRVGRAFVP